MSLYVSPRHPASCRILFSLSLLFPPRIMAFVMLSLILSWASLGAGTATAVVRKHCLLQNIVTLAYSFLVFVCLFLIGPLGNPTI